MEQINQGRLSERLYYEREYFIFEGLKGKRGQNHVGLNPPLQKGIQISNHTHTHTAGHCGSLPRRAILPCSSLDQLPEWPPLSWQQGLGSVSERLPKGIPQVITLRRPRTALWQRALDGRNSIENFLMTRDKGYTYGFHGQGHILIFLAIGCMIYYLRAKITLSINNLQFGRILCRRLSALLIMCVGGWYMHVYFF